MVYYVVIPVIVWRFVLVGWGCLWLGLLCGDFVGSIELGLCGLSFIAVLWVLGRLLCVRTFDLWYGFR